MKITVRRARWLAMLGVPLFRVLGASWKVRSSGHDLDYSKPDFILAFLHGDMLIPAHLHRKTPSAVIISKHGDGEVIAQIASRLGPHVAIRGSSSRDGAQAMWALEEETSRPWVITPDGPRGPRGSVHPGIVHLASNSGRAIVPVGFAISRGKRFRSWDRFVIPAPFARITSFVGKPMPVPPDIDLDTCRKVALELETRLVNAEESAQLALESWSREGSRLVSRIRALGRRV